MRCRQEKNKHLLPRVVIIMIAFDEWTYRTIRAYKFCSLPTWTYWYNILKKAHTCVTVCVAFYGVRNSVGVHDVSEVGSVAHMKLYVHMARIEIREYIKERLYAMLIFRRH